MEDTSPPTPQEELEVGATSIAMRIVAIIAVVYTLYLAKLLVLPILVAAFIALFMSPLVRKLVHWHVPKPVASVVLIALLVISLSYVFALLVEPTLRWLEALPLVGGQAKEAIRDVAESMGLAPTVINGVQANGHEWESVLNTAMVSVAAMFAQSAIIVLVQALVIIMITYFFLVYGEDLMRNFVRAQQTFAGKKLTVVMFQVIRNDLSLYILVVSTINIGLGLATALALWGLGVPDPLLWGALATLLNFAPYVGPVVLAAILTGVGFSIGDELSQILAPAGTFLLLNFIESQFVTPTVLGRRFNINPLLVVVWMLIWGWLWGPAGMLLAIPLLMCMKLIFVHLNLIGDWVAVLNGSHTDSGEESDCKNGGFFAIFTRIPLFKRHIS